MTDNELLCAISNIVQSHTNPIKQSVDVLTEEHRNTRVLLNETRSILDETRSVLDNLVDEHRETRSMLNNLVYEHRETRSMLNSEISQNLRTRILIENEILPRLQTIEACYTTTYHRYADGIQQLDTLQSDVDILKIVVAEHSEIIQKTL